MLRKESTRDHVDLLLSSKHWPLAYAVDMACDVVAHTEVRVPKLARAMWNNRRGCFQEPKKGQDPTVSLYDKKIMPLSMHIHHSVYRSKKYLILIR